MKGSGNYEEDGEEDVEGFHLSYTFTLYFISCLRTQRINREGRRVQRRDLQNVYIRMFDNRVLLWACLPAGRKTSASSALKIATSKVPRPTSATTSHPQFSNIPQTASTTPDPLAVRKYRWIYNASDRMLSSSKHPFGDRG